MTFLCHQWIRGTLILARHVAVHGRNLQMEMSMCRMSLAMNTVSDGCETQLLLHLLAWYCQSLAVPSLFLDAFFSISLFYHPAMSVSKKLFMTTYRASHSFCSVLLFVALFDRNNIERGMSSFQSSSCIRFRPRQSERDYLRIYSGEGYENQPEIDQPYQMYFWHGAVLLIKSWKKVSFMFQL